MNRKRFLLIICSLAIVGAGAFFFSQRGGQRPPESSLDSLDVQNFLRLLFDSTDVALPDLLDTGTELVKTVDESVVPYIVPGLCGYNPRDLRMGILTVRRDIDSAVYARAFPRFSMQTGQVDSIADVYLYIQPMDIFPEGEYGRVAYVIANDSFIQVQFMRGGVDEMVRNVSTRLDAVSFQLQELARQMENNEKME